MADDEALASSASQLSEREEGDSQISTSGYDADASLDAALRRRKQRSPRSRRRQALGACMQSMKGQVAFLQHLVRRQAEKKSTAASSERDCTRDLSVQSFSSLSPVHRAGADANLATRLLLQEDAWELDSEPSCTRNTLSDECAAAARIAALERENAALKEQVTRQNERSNETLTELLEEIEVLKRAARAREEVNTRLRSAVQRLTKQSRERSPEPAASEASAIETKIEPMESVNQAEDQALTAKLKDGGEAEEPESASATPSADQETLKRQVGGMPPPAVHIGHARCQVKIHELWQTIKNLKVYVETYRIESIDLKAQRDEAVESAEHAWRDNAKLAGNTNPQAKIRYLQAVKDENAVLAQKIRELQSRLAVQQAKRAAKRAGVVDARESSLSDLSESLDESRAESLAPPLETLELDSSAGDTEEPERSKLFRKMWQHNKELEAEIARLRDQKRELATPRGRSGSASSSTSTSSLLSSGAASKWLAVVLNGGGGGGCATGAKGGGSERPARVVQLSSGGDSPLPTGWQRVTHDSGLPCYVQEHQRLVCWSKPYVLDLLCSPGEFMAVAQQHVPPLSLFKPPQAREKANGEKAGGASGNQSKKRKLRAAEQERLQAAPAAPAAAPAPEKPPKEEDAPPSMTFEEFKALPIGDPRILQVCAELSYKTPAQVLQEYQNRNRGISINYNTHAVDQDGVKLFKTIVSAGNTAAEGIASTKRVAKQLGAQSLLGLLHERTAKTYYGVAELYSSVAKSSTAIGDTSSSHVFVPASAYREDVLRRPFDLRAGRPAAPPAPIAAAVGGGGGAGRGKKRDRRTGGSSGGGYAADYSGEAVGEYLEASAAAAAASGYPQAPRGYWGGGGYEPYYGSSGVWRPERDAYPSERRGDERERVVEYSQAPPTYGQQHHHYYYGDEAASWGYGGGSGGGGGSGYPPYAPAGAGTAAGVGVGAHSYGPTLPPGYSSTPATVGEYGATDGRYYTQQRPQAAAAPPVEGVYGQLKVRRRTDGK